MSGRHLVRMNTETGPPWPLTECHTSLHAKESEQLPGPCSDARTAIGKCHCPKGYAKNLKIVFPRSQAKVRAPATFVIERFEEQRVKNNSDALLQSVKKWLSFVARACPPAQIIVVCKKSVVLLANRNRPVVQPTGPLAIRPAYISSYVILHCLVNDLPLGQIAGNSPAPVEKQMLDNDQVCRVPATQHGTQPMQVARAQLGQAGRDPFPPLLRS
jgi:hypothetical protein